MLEVLEKPKHLTIEDINAKYKDEAFGFNWIMKRLQAIDTNILYKMKELGPTDRRVIKRRYGLEGAFAIRRLKVYGLIKAKRKPDHVRSYVLELTEKGLAMLRYEKAILETLSTRSCKG